MGWGLCQMCIVCSNIDNTIRVDAKKRRTSRTNHIHDITSQNIMI